MKKSLSTFALIAIFLLSVSAHTERIFDAAEGFNAPLFTVETSDSTLSLESINKGHYVLLSFWDSREPETRIRVNEYEAFVAASESDAIQLVTINLDDNSRLFESILQSDNLCVGTHLNLTDKDKETVMSLYHPDKTSYSFLIDPTGKIISVNPGKNDLMDCL